MTEHDRNAGAFGRAVFRSLAGEGPGWEAAFSRPESVRLAASLDEVPGVLAFAEAAALSGKWAVLAVAYEAAPAFDPALAVNAPGDFPLAMAAVYAAPEACPSAGGGGGFCRTPWRLLVSRRRYLDDLDRIREYLRLGESYQVNYAMPLEALFAGDPYAWFTQVLPGQAAGYAAFLDLGRQAVLCFSPELFFERRGREALTRPMKGTMPRGADPEADAALGRRLAACPKNRAENVMIVDLLRNDLGRAAEPGTVRAGPLFTVEAYPTLWQMTSEVSATLLSGTGLKELFGALFPCGSVTGAPKVRTMEIIRELEGRPRGIYCGALGFMRPGGDATFCVPIRTVSLEKETGRARFWAGSGVTHDSEAGAEYEECLVKTVFLERAGPPVRLLETLLLEDGRYALLPGHLRRMRASAAALGYDFDGTACRRVLEAARTGREVGRFRVRLLLAAGGRFAAEAASLAESPPVWRLGLAVTPVLSGMELLGHKTDWREPYDRAREERPDCDDVLLWNERGRITETTLANVAVAREGRLLTPPLSEGLLPGVMRSELLRRGELTEGVITMEEALAAGSLTLFNSVRGLWRGTLTGRASGDRKRG